MKRQGPIEINIWSFFAQITQKKQAIKDMKRQGIPLSELDSATLLLS